VTNEKFSLDITRESKNIVETIPGWAHDITNIGDEEMIVMLWANENFNPNLPDTFECEV